MRLSWSLGLWLTVMAGIVLGAHGLIQLRQEEDDLNTAARRELSLVATAIRSAVESAVRDDQEPDVISLLEQLEMKDPAVDIFVFDDGGTLVGSSWGSATRLTEARGLAQEAATLESVRIDDLSSGELVAIVPLRVRGSTSGCLVVFRPLNALQADLASERHSTVLSIGVLIAALSFVIWVVVRLRVHRPMSRIIAGVRQLRGGELSVRINLAGSDELAELAREFDAMAEGLEEARHHIASATEAHEKLEVEMQRANRMAIVGEVAATLAHEIGSPLQVLNGRARDLAARTDLPLDAKRSAAILVEQTDRVHQIVTRLLDVARRKAPELVELDVRQSVQEVVELVSAQARRLGVDLEVESRDVPHVQGDRAQVQQVLLNLLQNALRASSGGGLVRITISRSTFTRPSDARARPSVAITVDDTGAGIPEATLGQVFEPFFTSWNDDLEVQGTGLGLAVVKSIVTDHDGIVSAAVHPSGVGTRFVVHIPIRAARSTTAVPST